LFPRPIQSTTLLVSLQRAILQYPVMRLSSVLLIAVTLLPLVSPADPVVEKCTKSTKDPANPSNPESCADPANKYCFSWWNQGSDKFAEAGCANQTMIDNCKKITDLKKCTREGLCCCNDDKDGCTLPDPPKHEGKFSCRWESGSEKNPAVLCLKADTTHCYAFTAKNGTVLDVGCAEDNADYGTKASRCKGEDKCNEQDGGHSCCCKGDAAKPCVPPPAPGAASGVTGSPPSTPKKGAATSAFLLSTAAAMAAAGF
ncbi:hypothetical protein PMAYCL1PPCAC_22051, partial [Pristionchus mayeri]